ncbi:hypothetical protein N7497_001487 [Penicillium chrysogenum]|uniref:Uncharacterized protein n=1 Tax=Penicillium chrysogenum TaxID=5076 RepID=A0ABQ8WX34_PENCH|nr:hypothetical protein N7524_009770 [Penicillium chrysogenum]KAJ5283554.1 hypothetical protein N7505_001534 [Penicillium chrysogenum]KAJ6168644.1 hypothetical protein N7497_001487 [Penicillium chrysogenum]
MADDSQHPLWCKHCEVEGHLVIHCHALYEELTNFDAAFKMAQGQAPDPKNAYPVARWGQAKKKKDVSVPGINCPSNPFAHLSPWEADTLANYPEQQWAYWMQWEADALANYLDQQWMYFLQWHAAWSHYNHTE